MKKVDELEKKKEPKVGEEVIVFGENTIGALREMTRRHSENTLPLDLMVIGVRKGHAITEQMAEMCTISSVRDWKNLTMEKGDVENNFINVASGYKKVEENVSKKVREYKKKDEWLLPQLMHSNKGNSSGEAKAALRVWKSMAPLCGIMSLIREEPVVSLNIRFILEAVNVSVNSAYKRIYELHMTSF